MIRPELYDSADNTANALRGDFDNARPFKHLVLCDFFEEALLADLVREFPSFERTDCRNENGELGRKGVHTNIAELGGAYKRLDRFIQSQSFLDWLSDSTGIAELLYDPFYFGGGTHENRAGQELDLHIDFNFHPVTRWHRRLNLIIYLNDDWNSDWGGQLVLQQDPRDSQSCSVSISPQKNCCVIFETTESSWHGFEKIRCPDNELGRKSIALYFYTRERPVKDTADVHSTVYIDRLLPDHLHAGHTLSAQDIVEIRTLLSKRDKHLDRIYMDNQRLQAKVDAGLNRVWGARTVSLLRWCRYQYLLWKIK